MHRSQVLVILLLTLLTVPACAKRKCGHCAMQYSPMPVAIAEVTPLGKSGVTGTVVFKEAHGGVFVSGSIHGLKPNSTHGFHIHEKGDCSAADGSSAGGHFNPANQSHGPVDAADSHAGDLGNIQTNQYGVAKVDVFKKGAVLSGEKGFIGRGLIVHAKEDDLKSQPAGAAGDRIACAVVSAQEGGKTVSCDIKKK